MRCFLGFEIPPGLRQTLATLQEELRAELPPDSAKWVPPEKLHVTAVFLGNVEEDQVGALGKKVEEVIGAFQPFELTCAGMGAFPRVNAPRVLWAGLQAPPSAVALLDALRKATVGAGSASEANSGSLHLTLARAKDPRSRPWAATISKAIGLRSSQQWGVVPVDRVTLFRSELSSSGSRYSVAREFLLLHD